MSPSSRSPEEWRRIWRGGYVEGRVAYSAHARPPKTSLFLVFPLSSLLPYSIPTLSGGAPEQGVERGPGALPSCEAGLRAMRVAAWAGKVKAQAAARGGGCNEPYRDTWIHGLQAYPIYCLSQHSMACLPRRPRAQPYPRPRALTGRPRSQGSGVRVWVRVRV